MSSIYVVMGSCGEYSDRTEWAVAWYPTREQADRHSDRAAEDAKRIEDWHKENDTFWHENGPRPEETNAYDPCMQWSYTGADYFVIEVPQGWVQAAGDTQAAAQCDALAETFDEKARAK